jgi:hypothetical protein
MLSIYDPIMLNVIMLSVFMLNVVMLNVIVLKVVMLSVVMLNVVAQHLELSKAFYSSSLLLLHFLPRKSNQGPIL